MLPIIFALSVFIMLIIVGSGVKYCMITMDSAPQLYFVRDVAFALDRVRLMLLIAGILNLAVLFVLFIPIINEKVIPWIHTLTSP